MTSVPSDVLVLGVGSILQRDDGVGVRVVERLQALSLPPGVEVFDGGTAGLDLLGVVAGRGKVVVIDAVQGGGPPGAVYRFAPDDVAAAPHQVTSLHQVGLLETLQMARHLGREPERVVIFGVEPKEASWGLELSPEVAAVVPRVVELILAEIGCSPRS